MAAICKICELGSEKAHKIEVDSLNGMSVTSISKKYNVPYFSIRSHIENHMTEKMVEGASNKYAENGINLLERVDRLLEKVELIYERNIKKGRDNLALKAISEERSTYELIAKVSYALHQQKMVEVEATREEILNIDLPIHKLTKKEQDLYFQLQMKLIGDKEDEVNLNDFVEFEEVQKIEEDNRKDDESIVQDQNMSKTRIRRKRPPKKEEELSFKPIEK